MFTTGKIFCYIFDVSGWLLPADMESTVGSANCLFVGTLVFFVNAYSLKIFYLFT